jgi:leucyl-tRNA synthetase
MDDIFDHKKIEEKISKSWEESKIYSTPTTHELKKKYILDAFAYPSGSGLHVGHVEGYVATDIVARFYRHNNYNVLSPVGWDAFGLPAENYAIKTGLHPRINTDNAIKAFTEQVKALGLSNDWNDEIASHTPDYYKWTQWFFSFLYKKGLAYKKEALVNWDPVDQTVLANEQVLADGTGERSGAVVEQRLMSQWFFKITDYIEDKLIETGVNKGKIRKGLLNGLTDLKWPESTKIMQKNWIGKSVGAEVTFEIEGIYPVIGKPDLIDFNLEIRERAVALIRVKETGKYIVYKKKADENGSYFLSGGKAETGESFLEAAIRETKEEIGVSNLSFIKKIGACRYFYKDELHHTQSLEHYFLFEVAVNDLLNRIKAEIDDENSHLFGTLETVNLEDLQKNNWKNFDWLVESIKSHNNQQITVFTTRVDTIFGVSYLVLAPENHLVDVITTDEMREEVSEYQEKTKRKTQLQRTDLNKDKTGVWTGAFAINPINGKKVPIFIADYVLNTYGTGAVMGVPSHDERDFEFGNIVNEKYQDEVKINIDFPVVVVPLEGEIEEGKPFCEYGKVINSGRYNTLSSEDAKIEITKDLDKMGLGRAVTSYRLRDWLVSRQRYWGSPIPIYYKDGVEHLLSDEDLPVILPDNVEFLPTGKSPLIDNDEFNSKIRAKYGDEATMEVDTMDTFVCSSWYFFRFCDSKNPDVFADPKKMQYWCPVDEYVIGAEHTVLHLLYARFFTKVLFDEGLISFDEPFLSLKHPGMILGEDSRKMSKRWGNTINPLDVIEEYGADCLRLYEMFMGPFEQSKPWNTSTIKGVRRFIDRVWKIEKFVTQNDHNDVRVGIEALIKKITYDIPEFSFNTAVAEFMKFVNIVEEKKTISKETLRKFLIVLAPFCPFVTDELWRLNNFEGHLHTQKWPEFDSSLLDNLSKIVGVQINGKVRSEVVTTKEDTTETVLEKIKQDSNIQKWLEGKKIVKVIYVPQKILNVVVSD